MHDTSTCLHAQRTLHQHPMQATMAAMCCRELLQQAAVGSSTTKRLPFMAAGKQRAEHKVSRSDDPATVQEQWQGVLKVLQSGHSALLFHLENHYCLVFAARSWHLDAGQLRKLCRGTHVSATLLKVVLHAVQS